MQGGAAAWCIDFQKLQGHDITILGGMHLEISLIDIA